MALGDRAGEGGSFAAARRPKRHKSLAESASSVPALRLQFFHSSNFDRLHPESPGFASLLRPAPEICFALDRIRESVDLSGIGHAIRDLVGLNHGTGATQLQPDWPLYSSMRRRRGDSGFPDELERRAVFGAEGNRNRAQRAAGKLEREHSRGLHGAGAVAPPERSPGRLHPAECSARRPRSERRHRLRVRRRLLRSRGAMRERVLPRREMRIPTAQKQSCRSVLQPLALVGARYSLRSGKPGRRPAANRRCGPPRPSGGTRRRVCPWAFRTRPACRIAGPAARRPDGRHWEW